MLAEQAGDDRMIVVGNHALYPHPDVRESRELIAVLWELVRAGHDVRIAVDPNRVLSADAIPDVLLKDYWWGVKITRDSIDDLQAVGRSLHARPEHRYDEWGAFPLLSTEFVWKREDDEKILTIEETVPTEEPRPFAGPVRNRFLHSIRDTNRRVFRHLDGAVKAFDRDEYRLDRTHPSRPRTAFCTTASSGASKARSTIATGVGSSATSSAATNSSSNTSGRSSTSARAQSSATEAR